MTFEQALKQVQREQEMMRKIREEQAQGLARVYEMQRRDRDAKVAARLGETS